MKNHGIEKQISTMYMHHHKQCGITYKSHHHRDDKGHVSCSKAHQIGLDGSGDQCVLHTKPMSKEGIRFYYVQRSVKREETLYHTPVCVSLDASPMQ